jgi:hypothetical protein
MRHICCTMTRIRALPPPPRPARLGGEWRARVVFVRRHEDLFTARRAGTARKGGRASTGAPGSRSGRYGGGGEARTEQLTPESSVDSWKEGRAGVIQTKWRSSVVGERFYEAILASPHPWQSPDRIPIVGSARSLVPSDKRFNHSKVWCTFIFIDLQATGDCTNLSSINRHNL